MNKTSKFLTVLSFAAISTAALAVDAHDPKAAEGKEKCYGVVKAGKNDCGAKDGSHSCAGLAKTDSSENEWVFLPAGTCDRLAGGKRG